MFELEQECDARHSTHGAHYEPTAPTTTTPLGPVVRTGQQRLSPLYAQGVARIPGGWIFSGTNGLWKTDDKLKEVAHLVPAIPPAWKAKGFDHIGDIDVVGKYIYAPFEEPDYSQGPSGDRAL